MQIGSFIELQFPPKAEYYRGDKNIARLNSGRAGIYHAFRCTGCHAIWLPFYQCDTVRKFLQRKKVNIKYYHIDENFNPTDLAPHKDEAVLLVNYYGIMSYSRLRCLAKKYSHVIVDNSQGFFTQPLGDCYNVYSCRKFVGVPDGAYVIGEGAERYVGEYEQCYSSDTALFLLQRIEYGCEGKAYESRKLNEDRIDMEDIMKMSKLTNTILCGTDYDAIKAKRRANFDFVCEKLKHINGMDPRMYYDDSCVPMVYPLVVEDDNLIIRLQEKKHFQGHWWSYLLDEMNEGDFEYWLSRYIIPITIDQRYTKADLSELCSQIRGE